MPTNKEIASDIWLHVNSPETLDKKVGDHIAKLRKEARLDELSDYQNERKEIDATVDRYLNSPHFENYRQRFLEIDDIESPELERLVSSMARDLKYGVTEKGRDEIAKNLASDVGRLDQAIDRDLEHGDEEQSR